MRRHAWLVVLVLLLVALPAMAAHGRRAARRAAAHGYFVGVPVSVAPTSFAMPMATGGCYSASFAAPMATGCYSASYSAPMATGCYSASYGAPMSTGCYSGSYSAGVPQAQIVAPLNLPVLIAP